jgi:hypothetical protein
VNPACQVAYFGESGLAQKLYGLGTSRAHFAKCDDFAAGVQFVRPFEQLCQWDEPSANVGNLVFMFFTDIEQKEVVAGSVSEGIKVLRTQSEWGLERSRHGSIRAPARTAQAFLQAAALRRL